jgi:hypothetical protein
MKEAVREELRTHLRSLRPLLLNEPGCSFLDLFDEFLQEHEFGLALHVVCDFILQPDSPKVSKATVDQIQRLHTEMEIDDRCVEELQKRLA